MAVTHRILDGSDPFDIISDEAGHVQELFR